MKVILKNSELLFQKFKPKEYELLLENKTFKDGIDKQYLNKPIYTGDILKITINASGLSDKASVAIAFVGPLGDGNNYGLTPYYRVDNGDNIFYYNVPTDISFPSGGIPRVSLSVSNTTFENISITLEREIIE